MKYYFTLIIIAISLSVKSQSGFIKPYDFGRANGGIGSILYDSDTLYVLASVIDIDTTKQGFLLAKMDTFGNIYSKSEIYADGLNYVFSRIPGGFTKLEDGFLIMAGVFETNSSAAIRLDQSGNLVWRRHHPLVNSQLDHFWAALPSQEDFLITGKTNRLDFSNDATLIMLDDSGMVKWEKSFGLVDYLDYLYGIKKVGNNEFIIYGSTFYWGSWQQNTFTSAVYSFDSLGNQNWHWESPRSLEETGMVGLHIDSEGNYNYVSSKWVYNQDGSWKEQPKFFKRDKNFQVLEEKSYHELKSGNSLNAMIPVSGGGYLAVGGKIVPENDPNTPVISNRESWLLRLDENGDSLWSSEHLVFPDRTNFATLQELHSVVELPSGSFIAAGVYENFVEVKKWGFLIKVDKNGCLDTIYCHPVSSIEETIHEPIRVFPNPTSQNVTFSFSSSSNKQLIINDLSGRLIAEAMIPSYQNQFVWSSENYPPGVYFYQVFSRREKIQSGKIVVQR